ncbi:uncharacterized protein LOC119393126 [Rhipicephalus sanguineus]|uniref:uncharacterized protein LOC119393126 n=1 Tax=Rhipicephalus sanguineus TaxID=34632 RepID=UPI0018932758|nr:uncharacterized protein LOC119393126 [Rhipicephalus sanguineus]
MSPTLQLLWATAIIWCLTTPCHSGIILTGVAPGYEPEEPSFMYTNFGVVYGTRELQKQYQFNSATDEINHHHTDIVGTRGRIRENVTPYQGDANRTPTHSVEHNRQK